MGGMTNSESQRASHDFSSPLVSVSLSVSVCVAVRVYQMFSQWAADQAVMFVLSVALGVPLLSALLYLLHSSLSYQWLCTFQ